MFDDLYLLVKESIALQKYIPQIIFFQFIFLHTLQSCHTAKFPVKQGLSWKQSSLSKLNLYLLQDENIVVHSFGEKFCKMHVWIKFQEKVSK